MQYSDNGACPHESADNETKRTQEIFYMDLFNKTREEKVIKIVLQTLGLSRLTV